MPRDRTESERLLSHMADWTSPIALSDKAGITRHLASAKCNRFWLQGRAERREDPARDEWHAYEYRKKEEP